MNINIFKNHRPFFSEIFTHWLLKLASHLMGKGDTEKSRYKLSNKKNKIRFKTDDTLHRPLDFVQNLNYSAEEKESLYYLCLYFAKHIDATERETYTLEKTAIGTYNVIMETGESFAKDFNEKEILENFEIISALSEKDYMSLFQEYENKKKLLIKANIHMFE